MPARQFSRKRDRFRWVRQNSLPGCRSIEVLLLRFPRRKFILLSCSYRFKVEQVKVEDDF